MSRQRIRRGAAAVGLATSVLLAGCGADAETGGTAAPSPPVVSSPEPTGTPARGRRNATDEMWAAATLLHHDQAIDVADLILGRDGVDERVVRLAQSVRDRQRTQAGQLRGWLAGWDVDPARAAARMEEAMIERGHGGHGGSATGMLN